MDAHLRAGLAIYNAGDFHAAHDAWEDRWLALERGTDDERFLHGLIQFTAAIHHASDRNWAGATGLAESAREYLADLPDRYRGVDVAAVRRHLAAFAVDPELLERAPPPKLTHDGEAVALADLDFESTAVAAAVYAEAGPFDETVMDRAVEYARRDLDAGEPSSRFVTFVTDFVRDPDHRGIVHQRLSEHVDRRRRRETDVDGLF